MDDEANPAAEGRVRNLTVFRCVVFASAVMLSVPLVIAATGLGNPQTLQMVLDVFQCLSLVIGIPACVYAARHLPRTQSRPWSVVGLMLVVNGLAYGAEVVLTAAGATPLRAHSSYSDLVYAASIPLALVAISLLSPRGIATRLRALLDSLIVGSSILLVWWGLFVGAVFHEEAGDVVLRFATVSRPLGDIVFAFVAVTFFRCAPRALQPGYRWIAAGVLPMPVADLYLAHLQITGASTVGSLAQMANVIGGLGCSLAAYRICTLVDVAPREERALFRSPVNPIVPYVTTGVALIVVIVVNVQGRMDAFLSIGETILVLLFLARQYLALRENLQLMGEVERGSIALHSSERRFRGLVNNSSDITLVLDDSLTVQYVTPSIIRTVGVAEEEWVGRNLHDIIHPDDAGIVEERLNGLVREGKSGLLHFRVCRTTGEWVELETSASNLLGDPSVEGIVLNARDVTERRELERQLRHLAFHDPLTNLANRTLLRDRMDQALARAQRHSTDAAVLFIDLDGFKKINDKMGHSAGDRVIQTVALRVASCLRAVDTASRIGGDEFAILLEEVDSLHMAVEIAERVLAAIAEPMTIDGEAVEVGASVGLTLTVAGDRTDQILRRADVAMYRAKGGGRGCVEVELGKPVVVAPRRSTPDAERHSQPMG